MEKTYKDIELRSEEVQEVMNKVPPAILQRCPANSLQP